MELYKNRAPWLLFLMISSTFSSMVIRGYEDALAAVTVADRFIPMLTDAGGNAGSQSTSTIIRGMAVGDIEPHDLPPKILWREFRIAILCGGTLALCNFAKADLPGRHRAPCSGSRLPDADLHGHPVPAHRRPAAVVAEKLNFDPAVVASPAYHDHCRYRPLLVCFNIARVLLGNLNFRHRVQYCKLYRTRLVWYNFLEKSLPPEGEGRPAGG